MDGVEPGSAPTTGTRPGVARPRPEGTLRLRGTAPRIRALRSRVLPSLLLAALLTGCTGVPTPSPLPPGERGVNGVMAGVDDTGLPDHADGGGWVAAIPTEHLDALLDRAARDDWRPLVTHLPYVRLHLDEATVGSWGGEVAAVDSKGRSTIGRDESGEPPVTGAAIVCRLVDGTEGAITRGCDEVTLPERGTLRATWGEAGFHVGLLSG